MRRRLVTTLALALACLVGELPTADAAAPPAPRNIRVSGGEETWHATNSFTLYWDNPAGADASATRYQVTNPAGVVVVAGGIPWKADAIERIRLPSVPGLYRVEVWLENGIGEASASDSATLRFDDARPGDVQPILPGGWIGGASTPLLRIAHPTQPLPVSGIRGYAIAIDTHAVTAPCQGDSGCSAAETDLQSGVEGDSIRLGLLGEGTTFVHAVAVSGSGMRSGTVGTAIARVDATPPTVTLRGVPDGWARRPVTVTAIAADARSGMASDGPSGPFTKVIVDDSVPTEAPGDSVSATVVGNGTHTVGYYARDAAGNLSADGDDRPLATATVRIDREPPRVAFANALDPADPELIEARVSDGLSGPDPARGSIAIRPARSHQQFSPLPTSPSVGRLLARWDSDDYPAGQYELRATAFDTAGNEASTQRRANGTWMVLAGPLKDRSRLLAGFGGKRLVWHRCRRAGNRRRCRLQVVKAFQRRPVLRFVPYGRGVSFGGLLTASSGAPLAGAPVQVIETFDGNGNLEQRVTTVVTAGDGTFLTRLGPGPSREVQAAFAGTRTRARASGRATRLAVRAGVEMHPSSSTAAVGKRPIVFSGTVADEAAIPPEGKSVELQFRVAGLPWAQFRTVQTNGQGRFRYRYRFSDDDSRGVRFQFRALAPAEPGWPYEPATSNPVFVTGR